MSVNKIPLIGRRVITDDTHPEDGATWHADRGADWLRAALACEIGEVGCQPKGWHLEWETTDDYGRTVPNHASYWWRGEDEDSPEDGFVPEYPCCSVAPLERGAGWSGIVSAYAGSQPVPVWGRTALEAMEAADEIADGLIKARAMDGR